MSIQFLTRHREPKPTESLYGYVLTLTRENGYDTPTRVLNRAGIPASKVLQRDVDVGKLAKIVGHKDRLVRIAYDAQKWRHAFLLGQQVGSRDIRQGATALCLECIRETGFMEAHFDLKLMVACPVHNSYLTEQCVDCGEGLKWCRPGLLQCSCGAALERHKPNILAAQPVLNVLRLVREKVLGITAPASGLEGYLQGFLLYDLESLLFVVRQLGKHWSFLHGGRFDDLEAREVVSNAAIVLSDWPRSFHRLIRLAVEERAKQKHSTSVTKDFSVIYRKMFCLQTNGVRLFNEQGPLWKEYVGFAISNWGLDAVDPRTLRVYLRSVGNFLTAGEVSQRTGIHRNTIIQMVNDGKIEAYGPSIGTMRPMIPVDAASLITPKADGDTFHRRKAAKILGLSVAVLDILRSKGVYIIPQLNRKSNGFHEQDLNTIIQRFALLPRIRKRPTDPVVPLGSLMRYTALTPELKADLIEGILAGEIALFEDVGHSLDQMQISVNSVCDDKTRKVAQVLAKRQG